MINNESSLRTHLKIFRMKWLKEGYDEIQLYPMFCVIYGNNVEYYNLPKETVLDLACEVFIESNE